MHAPHLRDSQEVRTSSYRSHRRPILWPWFLVAAAWGMLVFATLTHQTFLLDHHYLLAASGLPWLAALEIFLLCWQVMMVAMMQPSSMPMLKLVVLGSRRQERPGAVPMAFLAGYGLIWTAFAAAAFVGDTLLHRLVYLWPWLAGHSWLIGALTFTVAGLFQLSPLKERSLKRCRMLLGDFMHDHWEGIGLAWYLGLRHGRFSLGCCWALMLVVFGLEVGNLAGMAVLTAVMVIEQTVPSGRRLSSFVGVVLLLLGLLWLVHPS